MKSEILKQLSDIASRETSYHNHKETIAWAALVLYFILVAQIINKISCQPFSTIVLLVTAVAVWCILHVQYSRRKDAANTIAACQRLIAEFLPMEDSKFKEIKFELEELTESNGKKGPSSKSHYEYILPKFIIDKMEELDKVGHSPRRILEKMSYLMLIVVTIVGFVNIWFQGCPTSG